MGNGLYDRFVELCNRKGEKPAVVCKRAGISASLPTEWKMGRKKGMSLATADKLATYLGVPVQELLGQQTPAPAAPQSAQVVTKIYPIKGYDKLDAVDRAKAEAFIAGLLSQDKYADE